MLGTCSPGRCVQPRADYKVPAAIAEELEQPEAPAPEPVQEARPAEAAEAKPEEPKPAPLDLDAVDFAQLKVIRPQQQDEDEEALAGQQQKVRPTAAGPGAELACSASALCGRRGRHRLCVQVRSAALQLSS